MVEEFIKLLIVVDNTNNSQRIAFMASYIKTSNRIAKLYTYTLMYMALIHNNIIEIMKICDTSANVGNVTDLFILYMSLINETDISNNLIDLNDNDYLTY